MNFRTLKDALRLWYEGEPYSLNTDPTSPIVILPGIRYRRHWTARAVRAVVEFHRREWRWAIPVYLTAIGLVVGVIVAL